MRVVAGELGGRRLIVPKGTVTRPTGDRVREATFNALDSAGALAGAVVLDVFAGSGALGIEALSRGAVHATFVERDRRALAALRANIEALALAGVTEVLATDVSAALTRPLPAGAPDLVVADPPYAFADWPGLLEVLADLVAPDAWAAVEWDRPLPAHSRWESMRVGHYGGTVMTLLRAAGPPHRTV